jgi:hypothetical protein
VQEVKNALEQLNIRAEQRQKDTLVKAMEGMPAGGIIQIIVQGVQFHDNTGYVVH